MKKNTFNKDDFVDNVYDEDGYWYSRQDILKILGYKTNNTGMVSLTKRCIATGIRPVKYIDGKVFWNEQSLARFKNKLPDNSDKHKKFPTLMKTINHSKNVTVLKEANELDTVIHNMQKEKTVQAKQVCTNQSYKIVVEKVISSDKNPMDIMADITNSGAKIISVVKC